MVQRDNRTRRKQRDQAPRDAIVISVGMQKGGVAKTTNATHLAVALAERGRKCLLWDVDENAGTTKLFQIQDGGRPTTFEVLAGDSRGIDAIVSAETEEGDCDLPPGVDVIPSSRRLTVIDAALAKRDPFFNANDCLRDVIEELRGLGRYDYIILDTGPSASITTRGAYMVSDYFILSVVPEKLAVDGLKDALEDIALARQRGRNPKLRLLGLILSCMDRRKALARWCEDQITKRFRDGDQGPVKFRTTIGTAAAIDRAAYEGQTLLQSEPKHRVALQYRALAREVEARIASHEKLDAPEKNAGRKVANG